MACVQRIQMLFAWEWWGSLVDPHLLQVAAFHTTKVGLSSPTIEFMMNSAPDSFIACYEIPSKQKKPCKYAEEKHACESSDRILLHRFAPYTNVGKWPLRPLLWNNAQRILYRIRRWDQIRVSAPNIAMFIPYPPHPTKSKPLSNDVSQHKVAAIMAASHLFLQRNKTAESPTL